jgi:hypothetical protein
MNIFLFAFLDASVNTFINSAINERICTAFSLYKHSPVAPAIKTYAAVQVCFSAALLSEKNTPLQLQFS